MSPDASSPAQQTAIGLARRNAVLFIVAIGTISLFADMAYEGARSATGPFLATLGASGAIVGAVAGGGELVGYALRMLSGIFADRTRRYWTFVTIGFIIQLGAVPLLSLAGSWQLAALLIVAERTGKALRNPARDALLSNATEATGHGWGFGLHQAMDQTGAVLGPLIVAAVMAWRGDYAIAFAMLTIPVVCCFIALFTAWRLFPHPESLRMNTVRVATQDLHRTYWIVVVTMSLVAAATLDYSLMAFHFQKTGTLPVAWIPVAYALANAMQAFSAFFGGKLFDRMGAIVLAVALALAAFAAACALSGSTILAFVGVALWGIGMGAQEGIVRAVIAISVAAERRASAFGTYNACFGIAWFAGSAIMGRLYDAAPEAVMIVSAAGQLIAALVIGILLGRTRGPRPAH
ncbi:MAG TPA: MFS transporter [Magnetospirillaceae bacterium]|jgi:MFS family permease